MMWICDYVNEAYKIIIFVLWVVMEDTNYSIWKKKKKWPENFDGLSCVHFQEKKTTNVEWHFCYQTYWRPSWISSPLKIFFLNFGHEKASKVRINAYACKPNQRTKNNKNWYIEYAKRDQSGLQLHFLNQSDPILLLF